MPDPTHSAAHQRCLDAGHHICHKPSGRTCIEDGCGMAAGTLWGPLWCPDHDQERLDSITRQMREIRDSFSDTTTTGGDDA